jgi:uncharacterized protein (DUF488 family)
LSIPTDPPASDRLVIYTIGHSTQTAEAFLDLLRLHGIRQLADVRFLPRSRRHPQFGQAQLASSLESAGIVYRHFFGLGGMRRPRPDSANTALREPAFRGYADHMQSEEFVEDLRALNEFAQRGDTSVMCAEALWWQCHRRLLADALLVRGVMVRHILRGSEPKPHELSEFARIEAGRVVYPGLL